MSLKAIFEREGLDTYGRETPVNKSKGKPKNDDPDMDLNLDNDGDEYEDEDEGDHDEPDGDEDGSQPSDGDGDEPPAKPMKKSFALDDQALLEQLLGIDGDESDLAKSHAESIAETIEVSPILQQLAEGMATAQADTRRLLIGLTKQFNQRLATLEKSMHAQNQALNKGLGATFGELDVYFDKLLSTPATTPNSGVGFNLYGAAPHVAPPKGEKPITVSSLTKSRATDTLGALYREGQITDQEFKIATAHLTKNNLEAMLSVFDTGTQSAIREVLTKA